MNEVFDPESALRQARRAQATTRASMMTAGWLPLGAAMLGAGATLRMIRNQP